MKWWWRAGQPVVPPPGASRTHEASHQFILFRHGQFQVEQITLYPIDVPEHSHPDIRTHECLVCGAGVAELEQDDGTWWRLDYEPAYGHHPRARRFLIEAGQLHRGRADQVTIAISFQHWLNNVTPTFITDNWEGPPWL